MIKENKIKKKKFSSYIAAIAGWMNILFLQFLLVVFFLCAGGIVSAQEQPKPPVEQAESDIQAQPKPTVKQIKSAIVDKNIFKPKNIPLDTNESVPEPTKRDTDLPRVRRRFTLKAWDNTEDGPRAHLWVENPGGSRTVQEEEWIEFVKVLKIYPNYMRCLYVNREVNIYLGEDSDDVCLRLEGFGANYKLVGITIGADSSRALIYFRNKYYWVEIGDKLDKWTIFDILPDKVVLKGADGEEIDIVPAPHIKPKPGL